LSVWDWSALLWAGVVNTVAWICTAIAGILFILYRA
jgi:hypothetical protein